MSSSILSAKIQLLSLVQFRFKTYYSKPTSLYQHYFSNMTVITNVKILALYVHIIKIVPKLVLFSNFNTLIVRISKKPLVHHSYLWHDIINLKIRKSSLIPSRHTKFYIFRNFLCTPKGYNYTKL